MRSGKTAILVCVVLACVGGCVWLIWWKQGQPRRQAYRSLQRLDDTLSSPDGKPLSDLVLLPAGLVQRTIPEQTEFLTKSLQDELSPAGLAALKKGAAFGPLGEVFPAEAARWSQQAGMKVEECVAFKMERDGVRAEVVLLASDKSYRVIRCNNVKQMAMQ